MTYERRARTPADGNPADREADRPGSAEPWLHGLTDLRPIVALVALCALLAAGASGVAARAADGDRNAGQDRSEPTPRTAPSGSLGQLHVGDLAIDDPRWPLQSPLGRLVGDVEKGGADRFDAASRRPVGEATEQLARFYRERRMRTAWWSARRTAKPAVDDLLAALRAEVDGIPGSGEHAAWLAGLVAAAGDAESRAVIDAELTAAFLARADHLLRGRVAPDELSEIWRTEPRQTDLAALLADALEGDRVAAALAGLSPQDPEYQRLAAAYPRYRRIAEAGGWPQIPDGPVVEAGEELPAGRYRALVGRLYAEGYLSRAAAESRLARFERAAGGDAREPGTPRFDRGLAAALSDFQAAHGLEADGILGAKTMAELDVGAGERARQIALNLERWRWLPADLGRRHVRVNIPAYELAAVRDGRVMVRMPVVVGRAGWPTPVISESIERVVVNPHWDVPRSILLSELGPRFAEDPGYFERQGFELFEDGERVARSAVVDYQDPKVRLRQTPGAANALGRIKFLFPNRYNVYLHDTPSRAAFARPERALSHGCVRVERPFDLAAFVFADGRHDMTEVRRRLASRRSQTLELAEELPVHLLYFTAFVGDGGRVQFRRDVYGYDAAHREALRRKGWAG